MPIQIRELHIKTTVSDRQAQAPQTGGSASASDKKVLIEECVEQVMDLLNRKKDR